MTKAQLQEIQARTHDPDTQALLWEVARLRGGVLKMHDYLRQTPQSSTGVMMREMLAKQIEDEPAVQEQPKL